MNLDIGCGKNVRPGYIGVDADHDSAATYHTAVTHLTREHPDWVGKIDKIYSRHMLEHLSYPRAKRALAQMKAVLKPGGELDVWVPDIVYHGRQLQPDMADLPAAFNSKYTNREHAIRSLAGWQRQGQRFDIHKSQWDDRLLHNALARAGFENIRRDHMDNEPWSLRMRAQA